MLEFDEVSFSYGAQKALTDISLKFYPGERVAVLGSSGSGKSTLIKCAATVLNPLKGSFRYKGENPSKLNNEKLQKMRAQIGTIYQELNLVDSLKVVHNINAGRMVHWSTASALLSLIRPKGLNEVKNILEKVQLSGLEFRRTGELSGGQKQRVAVAKILLQDPEVILGDEPISDLDDTKADIIMDLICKPSNKNNLVITALHNVKMALKYHSRIIGMKRGKIEFDLASDMVTDSVLEKLYAI